MHTMSGSKEESMHNEDTTEFRVHASMKTTYHISDGEPPGQKKYLQALNRESPAILQLAQASSLDQTTRATWFLSKKTIQDLKICKAKGRGQNFYEFRDEPC